MNVQSARTLAGLVFAAAIITQACDCDRGRVGRSYGELGIVHHNESDQVLTLRDATYDFGNVTMGESAHRRLVVKNLGGGELTLLSIDRVDGSDITLGPRIVDAAPFEVRFVPGTGVGSQEIVEFDMFFTPKRASGSQLEENYLVKVVLSAAGTRSGEDTATVTLRGTALAGDCHIPSPIDFGNVALGMHGSRSFELRNSSSTDTRAFIGELTSDTGDHAAFGFAPGSPAGEFAVPAGTAQGLNLGFTPTETRVYTARVRMRAGSSCDETEVVLTGRGVDEVLEWTPASLDFRYVNPGTEALKYVTFKNHGSVDVELFGIAHTLPSDFAVKSEPGGDPTRFVVPGNGERQLAVVCQPTALGARSSVLTFNTPIARQPAGTIPLTCYGGGPDIEVIPSPVLNFGKSAYFANPTPPWSVTRRLTVLNRGTSPPDGSPDGNLRLGQMSLKPLNATTAEDEFTVSVPPSYQPDIGLEATVGNKLDLVVTLTPKSVGRKEAELTIFSNDPDESETKIQLSSDAMALSPCNYSVSPARVSFGLVSPGTSRDVPVTFRNLGAAAGEICLISGVGLAPGTDPSYSLPDGEVLSKELGPGETFQVLVRVSPQGTVPTSIVTLAGTLQFSASTPNRPSGTVPLETQVGPACLTIAPAHLDFGAVKPGCSTSTRTFAIYNICPETLTLQGITMVDGAGQQPGGPNCAGAAACPEFHFVQTPAIPANGLPLPAGSNPVNFQARYGPIDLGVDSGVIGLSVLQGGVSVSYLVTLTGRGDPTGMNTDTFVQNAQPMADVLFTIDNSCSMAAYQLNLANNFASFISYAQTTNVDWQIGVTTTDMYDEVPSTVPGIPGKPEGAKGRLIGDANTPRILTPNTPNVADLFSARVNVGIDGSGLEQGLEPSLRALTPPLSVNENAGFVRPDANLAVVLVTDARDQSGNTATYYVNSFLNIKGFNRANMFTFNAIAGFNPFPVPTCAYDSGPDDGTLAAVVQQTHGILEEICTPDWASSLQGLGKTAFGFRTTFHLTSVPDTAQPITVTLNGVNLPPSAGGVAQWSYDPVSNAIVFAPASAPGPGETMEVTYQVVCMP